MVKKPSICVKGFTTRFTNKRLCSSVQVLMLLQLGLDRESFGAVLAAEGLVLVSSVDRHYVGLQYILALEGLTTGITGGRLRGFSLDLSLPFAFF